jgi:hypothetical protein
VVREDAVASDFGFFQRSLNEKRVYRVTRDYERDILKELGAAGAVDILEDAEEHTLVAVTNLMDPGAPNGVEPVEEKFGLSLPREMDAFYRRWNGGLLLYRSLYTLLNVRSIIQTAIEFRRDYGVPRDLPWHVLRFCEIGDSDCFALRRRPDGGWEVILAVHEYDDTEFLEPEDPKVDARRVLSDSFHGWLQLMDETDGWPWGPRLRPPNAESPCQRVGW